MLNNKQLIPLFLTFITLPIPVFFQYLCFMIIYKMPQMAFLNLVLIFKLSFDETKKQPKIQFTTFF